MSEETTTKPRKKMGRPTNAERAARAIAEADAKLAARPDYNGFNVPVANTQPPPPPAPKWPVEAIVRYPNGRTEHVFAISYKREGKLLIFDTGRNQIFVDGYERVDVEAAVQPVAAARTVPTGAGGPNVYDPRQGTVMSMGVNVPGQVPRSEIFDADGGLRVVDATMS